MGPERDPVQVRVPRERWERWVANFAARHGATSLSVTDGCLVGAGADGSHFTATLPFATAYDGPAVAAEYASAATPPAHWGILLVRKGGFAIARLEGEQLTAHKIGQRHVQGRTKAGGQSQQRFARRRGNQARQAFEAAADHAAALLGPLVPERGPVVTGGDRSAVEAVLADPRLVGLNRTADWLDLPDPRRRELDAAILTALALGVSVVNV